MAESGQTWRYYHQDLRWELIHWALRHKLRRPKNVLPQPPSRERPGKTGSICASEQQMQQWPFFGAVEDSTPGQPFRIAGTKCERLPMLEPEHLARRRKRVPAPTLTPLISYSSGQSFRQGRQR